MAQQTFVGLQDLLKTSSTRLQRNNFLSSKTFWRHLTRRLEDVLEDKKLLRRWRLEDVSKASCRETKGLLGISVSNKFKCASKKSLFPKSISDETKPNPKCINLNPVILIFVLFWNSSSISLLRNKISSDDCSVLWNQLNSNSTLQNRWGNKNEVLSNIL